METTVATQGVISRHANEHPTFNGVNKSHTSAFNVKFCLYGTYIEPYIMVSVAGSVGYSYHC